MSLGELYQQDVDRSLSTMAAIPPDPPKRDERTAWGAPWRAVKAAVADVAGSTADVLKGYGAASAMTLEADPVARAVLGDKAVREGASEGRRQIATGEEFVSDVGQSFRQVSKDQRPDPATASKAEQIVFGMVRPLSKLVAGGVVAGPFGIVAAAGEEGFTQSEDLREQGVDFATRTKIGTLTAGVNAVSAFLPMAGPTLKATAGLYLLGGPGAFMAQQQATRKILEEADYSELAKQYDPLDPTGLVLSALIPLPFAAHGAARNVGTMRAADAVARDLAGGRNPDGSPSPRGSNATPKPEAAPAGTPDAIPTAPPVPPEVVDAAMVHNLTLQQDVHESTHPVVGVAEVMRPHVTETPEFKAWFGESKATDAEGKPLVVYHGTAGDFDAFEPGRAGSAMDAGKLGEGVYLSESPKWASNYAGSAARASERAGANVMPVYVSMKNPLTLAGAGDVWSKLQAVSDEWGLGLKVAVGDDNKPNATWSKSFAAEAQKRGFDGVVLPSKHGNTEYVAFRPEQIKSAIGNSGRFDPNSASLTDPVPRAAATEAAPPKPAAEAGDPIAKLNEPADAKPKPAADPIMSTVATRVADLESTAPDMVVRIADDGKHVTLADDLAEVRRMVAEGTDDSLGTLDADLIRVAVECALSTGG